MTVVGATVLDARPAPRFLLPKHPRFRVTCSFAARYTSTCRFSLNSKIQAAKLQPFGCSFLNRYSDKKQCRPQAAPDLLSEAEKFMLDFQADEFAPPEPQVATLQSERADLQQQVDNVQRRIDEAFQSAFREVQVQMEEEEEPRTFTDINEEAFGKLAREEPQVMAALLAKKESEDMSGWTSFQSTITTLKLTRTRLVRQMADVEAALEAAEAAERHAAMYDEYEEVASGREASGAQERVTSFAERTTVKMVLISGFESFNVDLYKKVAVQLSRSCPGVTLRVFSDLDIKSRPQEVAAALSGADVFFGSLLFDFDEVEWLRARVADIPVRLVFESALELMGCTQIGTFKMSPSGQSKGPPPAVKKVLSLFGSGREEDRMVGYLSFLKVGPKLLKFLPGKKVRDLRNWLTVYSYWNQGGLDNVVHMFTYLLSQYFNASLKKDIPPAVETPQTGCVHPAHNGYFTSPQQYMAWYEREGPVQDPAAPTVAVLLYRKHVITDQPYINQLIECMEEQGVRPVPIFINGVEAHTVVRDQLTTLHEQQLLRSGSGGVSPTLRRDAVMVDALVNTIGFPLVGGPAGTMEGGRQAEVAKAILSAKNVPYIVAAPLLIQDLGSWVRDGVAGLQSVVLYSLPELDGAIDTVPLGGLVGNNIYLIPERVIRLSNRIKKWVNLRKKAAHERKIAVLLYGFPPGVGAIGTAALLNVPKSLAQLLQALKEQGYNMGELSEDIDGEALINALKMQDDQRTVAMGADAVLRRGAGPAEQYGVKAAAAEVAPKELKAMLTFPPTWGPTEWGPIPFLPDRDYLVTKVEKQWGELGRYRGLSCTAKGHALVSGLQCGNVWIGVQPLLGLEGDPMRLLFERDLTPHPQYAAFYKWLQDIYSADVVLHFGMHGTVEWLPGAPLGNSGLSWSDILLGDMPNVYVYAANNPSESIIAKRRGYGTIVSHNVPPYGRAGLYKQLAELKNLVNEYRDAPDANQALRAPIVECLNATGLQEDCPFACASDGRPAVLLDADTVEDVPQDEFSEYVSQLHSYLQVVENRLFSEGLHVLGQPPSPSQMAQYLSAYFGEDLPEEAVTAVAECGDGDDISAMRAKLERIYSRAAASTSATSDASQHSRYDGELLSRKLDEALSIKSLLQRNTEELASVLAALRGEYILPEAGGDLLRDGAGVLPTGRNIHALDPYRMPSLSALQRGTAVAAAILQQHLESHEGAYPETVAVNLWGLDAIKTKGESVSIVLHMVGARPVQEGTGRIARFELIPLEELGRPRVDVLCNMSGIFRDSFQNVVELLDDMFARAAEVDEPEEQNYIRKHALAMKKEGMGGASARLFSNPAGDYGSMVNERVGASNWDNGEELGETWVSRNAFSYGKGGERGTARPEVLRALLKTTNRVVQEIDSVEYGLTDIQEYYANTGALKKAAETASGQKVSCSIVEAFGKDVKPKDLDTVLRLEYRSKLLNPRWAEAMANQGSGGAFEISQRMTAMVGWGATTSFSDAWAWDQAAETYAFDPEMAEKLRKNNPQAFSNVVKRMLEAVGRGMWKPDKETVQKLQLLYNDLDAELEGIK